MAATTGADVFGRDTFNNALFEPDVAGQKLTWTLHVPPAAIVCPEQVSDER
jgi:hypothetical protein